MTTLLNQIAADEPTARAEGSPQSYVRELKPRAVEERETVARHAEPDAPAADHLIQALVEAGVHVFFGIPGGPISPVFDAILRHPIAQLVESRHETSAAFAAADFHRASGKTAAVVVTAGPGATNVVTGVVSAHLERVPMLVICGDVAWAAGGKLLQDSGPAGIAVEKLLANVTRATIRVGQAQTAASQGLAALKAAELPLNPGPALLVLPIQQGRARTGTTHIESARIELRAAAPAGSVERTAQLLVQAERPLLVLGSACRRHAVSVRALVDSLNIPFVTTPQAKGVVSEEHPRSLRHGGLAASYWARTYTARGVDAALVLGTDLDDCSVGPTPYVKDGGKLVHVDLDASVFGRNLKTESGIVADLKQFADSLTAYVQREGLRHPRSKSELRELKLSSAFEDPLFSVDSSMVITPPRAIADLQAAAAPGATFITDIGEHMLFALHYLTAKSPDDFTIHLGLGSMGSGISGSLGLALAKPDRQVICVCGDGGMQMVGMEALVALKHQLPIIFAVFNDARYNMVYHGYKQVFGREAAWETPWTDFARWGRSMGAAGITINRPGEINAALLTKLSAARKPVILDIRIDRDAKLTGGGRNEALSHMSMQVSP